MTSTEAILDGIEWPRARTGNSGGEDEFRRDMSRSADDSTNRIPLMEDFCLA